MVSAKDNAPFHNNKCGGLSAHGGHAPQTAPVEFLYNTHKRRKNQPLFLGIYDKIQNKIRWRIIAKGIVNEDVTIILNKCLQNVYGMNLRHTKVSVDVNPNNMM